MEILPIEDVAIHILKTLKEYYPDILKERYNLTNLNDFTEVYEILGENERTSQKLTVSEQYKNIFKQIKNYINEQNKILNDDNFDNEIEILDKLINA